MCTSFSDLCVCLAFNSVDTYNYLNKIGHQIGILGSPKISLLQTPAWLLLISNKHLKFRPCPDFSGAHARTLCPGTKRKDVRHRGALSFVSICCGVAILLPPQLQITVKHKQKAWHWWNLVQTSARAWGRCLNTTFGESARTYPGTMLKFLYGHIGLRKRNLCHRITKVQGVKVIHLVNSGCPVSRARGSCLKCSTKKD